MRPTLAAVLLASAASLTSCSSTSLVSERVGPEQLEAPLRRVVLIGVSDDVGQRIRFENAFAVALESRARVDATTVTSLVEPERSLDKDLLRTTLTGAGFDGILVVRKLGERAEVSDRRSGGIPEIDVNAYDDFHGRYLGTMSSSSSEVATRMVRVEVTLLRGTDFKEVWTGTTDSRDPRDVGPIAGELAGIVVHRLGVHGML